MSLGTFLERKSRVCCTRCHAEVDAGGLERRRLRHERLGAALGLPANTPPLDSTVLEIGWRLFGQSHTVGCGVCGTTRAEEER